MDAFWAAAAFRRRVKRVVAEAADASALGRWIDAAFVRAIRAIGAAADGGAHQADARLVRAREAIGQAMILLGDLVLDHGVRDVVLTDLRDHAVRLVERLQMLRETPVHTWAASNYLPTVLDEVKAKKHAECQEASAAELAAESPADTPMDSSAESSAEAAVASPPGPPIDVVAALVKVPSAAVRNLPQPILADAATPAHTDDPPPARRDEANDEAAPSPEVD